MRSASICALWFALAVTASAWPWPWHHHNHTTTTTPPPAAVHAFEDGVAAALGFLDVESCVTDTKSGVDDLWIMAEDYKKGGFIAKSKALALFGKGLHKVIDALGPCADSMTDAEKYKKLIMYMMDPRYYKPHNALTLALNIAEDRHQLKGFEVAWEDGNYAAAGSELVTTALDILLHPGIPENNGTEAIEIAAGIAEGFTMDVNLKCFTDLSVEIPALIGGVIDIATGVGAVNGLESIFHALEGLVPTYKACMADKPKVMNMLHEFEDFLHPSRLAKDVFENMKHDKIDISLNVASAVLAYKGAEWTRFGEEIGKMLAMMSLPHAAASEAIVV